jgi:hypothetical protein
MLLLLLLLLLLLCRVTAVLYEGFQPVEVAPGQQVSASTTKRLVAPLGSSSSSAPGDPDAAGSGGTGVANFNEGLSLKGVRLSGSSSLVFELHMAKPGLAGLPTKEVLVGWAALPVLSNGQVRLRALLGASAAASDAMFTILYQWAVNRGVCVKATSASQLDVLLLALRGCANACMSMPPLCCSIRRCCRVNRACRCSGCR